jgi:predicted O-methyltransferase YrrM
MSKPILYSQGAVVEQVCFMDEYIRAFMRARDEFAKYWCGVMEWDENGLTDDQFTQITNHPDWRKPCINILPYGHLTEDDEQKLRMYSKGVRCAVELGTFLGRGAAILSENAKRVVTIDNYSDEYFGGIFHDLDTVRERLHKYRNIRCVCADSSSYAKEIIPGDVDLLFIDADHSYEGVKRDFEACFPVLASGAYILFHDSVDADRHPGATKYVEELKRVEKLAQWSNFHNNKDVTIVPISVPFEFVEAADKNNGSITVFRKR